jgi:hypothetical protein
MRLLFYRVSPSDHAPVLPVCVGAYLTDHRLALRTEAQIVAPEVLHVRLTNVTF